MYQGYHDRYSLAHTIEIKQSEAIKAVLIKEYQFKEKLGKAWLK